MADSNAGARAYDRLGAYSAFASAVLALLYTLGFVVLKNAGLYSVSLAAGGVVSAIALLAVYERLRGAGPLARLGAAFALVGAVGAAVHGAYDLATYLHPEAPGFTGQGPFPVDPRGFLTFGVAGLGVLALSWAARRVDGLPRNLAYLGLALGVVLVLIYLARLIVLDASSILVLGPAAVGAILSLAWYVWIGWLLLQRRA